MDCSCCLCPSPLLAVAALSCCSPPLVESPCCLYSSNLSMDQWRSCCWGCLDPAEEAWCAHRRIPQAGAVHQMMRRGGRTGWRPGMLLGCMPICGLVSMHQERCRPGWSWRQKGAEQGRAERRRRRSCGCRRRGPPRCFATLCTTPAAFWAANRSSRLSSCSLMLTGSILIGSGPQACRGSPPRRCCCCSCPPSTQISC